jgi:hypothetical protein
VRKVKNGREFSGKSGEWVVGGEDHHRMGKKNENRREFSSVKTED